MRKYKYFITPPVEIYLSSEEVGDVSPEYIEQAGGESYTRYNYLKPGIVSYLKTRHFEIVLKLTKKYFHRCNVIDFGCADGAFIPSLSKYFNHVFAIDQDSSNIRVVSKLVKKKEINNVDLLCNYLITNDDIKEKKMNKNYHIIYLLETLEHVGNIENLYESKMIFLRDLATLIDNDGIIVISVPNMIGLSYFIQWIAFKPLGVIDRPMSKKNLFKSCFLKDTSDLEKQRYVGHLGFNHEKMEDYIKKEFKILEKKNIISQMIYIIKKQEKN